MPRVARAQEAPPVTIPQKLLVGDDVEALLAHVHSETKGDADAIERLIHARAERSGKSPLHLAAWRGSLEVVEALLSLGCDIDQVSTGRHNYGKSAIFYALTRCRDEVVMKLLERGCKTKIVNNKGQSVLSLALSHCAEETIKAIQEYESAEEGDWLNFRDTHSDGLRYGDLDSRFYPLAAAEPGRGVSTRESRRRNFSRLNKGVSWDNPDGIDLNARKKALARAKREQDALDLWEKFDAVVSESLVEDGSALSDRVSELVTQLLRAETALAASGQKPDVAPRIAETIVQQAELIDQTRMLSILVGARVRDYGISDRVQVREEKNRRASNRILASAVATAMNRGVWRELTARELFDLCGNASTYDAIRPSLRNEGTFTEEQIRQAICSACREKNCRELNDIVSLLEVSDFVFDSHEISSTVTEFAYQLFIDIDESDPTSVAHTAVNLAQLGAHAEGWKVSILNGLDQATASMGTHIVSKIARRFGETWENDLTALASPTVISCIESTIMKDLMERCDWLEAKAYASTRDHLRDFFARNIEGRGDDLTLEDLSLSTNSLPLLMPRKQIALIDHTDGLAMVKEVLSSEACETFAFDCEWRDPRPMSTLQISPAHTNTTFVIDCLNLSSEIGEFIKDVFSDASTKKLAFAPDQDWKRLKIISKAFPHSSVTRIPESFHDANVVDLQGDVINSLASIVADTLGYALDKRCQRSNWDMRPLSIQQRFYAALDAEVLIDIARVRGIIDYEVRRRASSHPDAHLYLSDAVLYRAGTPGFGADLTESDAEIFQSDARSFGANLWESDRLLFTTAESERQDRKETLLRDLERSAYVNTDISDADTCSVCLNEMSSGEKLIRTTCNHIYHANCLISALRSSNALTCPLCRASFDPLTSD